MAAPGSLLYQQHPERVMLDPPGKPTYMRLIGTSMASAVTSGVVALIVEQHRRVSTRAISANEVKAILQFTALPVADADALTQGAGGINGGGALAVVASRSLLAMAGRSAITATLPPVTMIGAEANVWGQSVVWGNTVVWGNVVYGSEKAWSSAVIWGSSIAWDNGSRTRDGAVISLASTRIGNTVWTPVTVTGDFTAWANAKAD